MKLFLVAVALVLVVSGCSKPRVYADDAAVAQASYQHNGPPSMTLYTMINNRTGEGAHTALMINSTERVMFDPAGSFYSEATPERDDVLFGITPSIERAYRSAHARSTYHVVTQTVDVSPEQARTAYDLALSNGTVADAFCTSSTSALLRQVPGFESIRGVMYPRKLMDQFEQVAGVRTEQYYESDSPDLQRALAEGNAVLTQNAASTE